MMLSLKFLKGSKLSRRLITAAKDKKGKRGKANEKLKIGRALRSRSFSCPKTLKKFDVCVCQRNKACCHVGNAFLNGLEVLWPVSTLKIPKMSKKLWESTG